MVRGLEGEVGVFWFVVDVGFLVEGVVRVVLSSSDCGLYIAVDDDSVEKWKRLTMWKESINQSERQLRNWPAEESSEREKRWAQQVVMIL